MTLTGIPIFAVDFFGSVLMIFFSLLSLYHVWNLKKSGPDNLMWTYLFWVCVALATFAISRSSGHILKQLLFISGNSDRWSRIAPYSGTVNTFVLIIVASITLFFERVWNIYDGILKDKKALQKTHEELVYINQNLERIVAERTEALARSEKQMAQADRLASIGQLSAGIAHEINNPLGIILGFTQLLKRDESDGSQRYNDLKTIEKHVLNCQAIVSDLLNFARNSPTRKKRVHVHETIDEVVNFIRHHAKLGDVIIDRYYDDETPPLMVDEEKIRQVLINLVMNALHAVGKAGTIRISTEFNRHHRQVALHVADTGYGIERKNLTRIFDPFFTTKPTGEGTGLGLSVSYGIIKNHGGDILVESQPGQGARFTLLLPAAGPEETET
ncbi:MAG: ATP-binding protein [Pseudomonadota bacterium]